MTANPRFHRQKLGAFDVVSLHDGTIQGSLALFPEAERPALAGLARASGLDPDALPLDVHAFLIRTPGRTILIDTGTGPSRGESLGHVGAALAASGASPGDIDTVFMTHMHGDHAGALLDAEGRPAFPNATLVLAGAEHAFWSDPGLADRSPERMQPTIRLARNAFAGWAGRIRMVSGETELCPGVSTVPLPGHTPGHTGLMVESEGERLFLFADILHIAALQAPRPDIAILFDIDGAAAVETRRRGLALAADEGLRVAGFHLPFPAFGRIERVGEAFAFSAA